MLNNITMGQYYPVDSRIHRLDPRIKLVLTIVFIVAVFMAKTFLGYALILGFVWLTSRLGIHPVLNAVEHIREDSPIPEVAPDRYEPAVPHQCI